MVPDRDAFGLVLLLLGLEGELDEELLQFLVTVVDAKLFEAADVTTVRHIRQGYACLLSLR